ncbi:hypothetical protein EVAR_68191_1 [Eumeta japonica]|uniref:Uncharacterized protein n=1 Tax=Eumeta variegata TaxID=151549 RepID=A0A4C2A132_EUMVA|nr:hypothetical protein EVAR_68191_1 [Eumeta japonica]
MEEILESKGNFMSNKTINTKDRVMNCSPLPRLTYECQMKKFTARVLHKIIICQRELERSNKNKIHENKTNNKRNKYLKLRTTAEGEMGRLRSEAKRLEIDYNNDL